MKSFNLEMVEIVDAPIVASLSGQGKVQFETVKETEAEFYNGLRKQLYQLMTDVGTEPDTASANALMFDISVLLVSECLLPKMEYSQAVRLVSMAGGYRGELIRQIAIRFGVLDLIAQGDDEDGGLQDELPT